MHASGHPDSWACLTAMPQLCWTAMSNQSPSILKIDRLWSNLAGASGPPVKWKAVGRVTIMDCWLSQGSLPDHLLIQHGKWNAESSIHLLFSAALHISSFLLLCIFLVSSMMFHSSPAYHPALCPCPSVAAVITHSLPLLLGNSHL